MLISNRYADNKLYRGIRHYDKLPLLSEDIHEYADTLAMKNAYIMNHIVGHGTLNAPTVEILATGLRLVEPTVVLLDGDVSLVQADEGNPIVTNSQISTLGASEGVVCIVGWYQHILASSSIRNYGGVDNSILDNNLLDNEFNVQVSTRYQFRWTPIILSKSDIESGNISFSLPDRDDTGLKLGTSTQVSSSERIGNVFVAARPGSMTYAETDLFVVPIIDYTYDSSSRTVSTALASTPTATRGSGTQFLKSETEPEGEYPEGTVWYNPVTSEFKTYVAGVGFVDSASTMAFIQYQSIQEISETITTPQDISVPIGISELEEGDILQVVYEGLTLVVGENYSINYENNTITLLGFTVDQGDKVAFTAIKIIESNGATSIAVAFTRHISETGSGSVKAHVKLSDTANDDLGENSGIAATPKAVYQATVMTDPTTGLKYKLGVSNGILYVEEV